MDYQAPGGRGCYNSCTQAAKAPIKPATAQSAAPRPATTAARKVMSAVNAAPPRKKNHVTAAVKLVTSHASVPILPEELHPEAWAADTLEGAVILVEAAAKNATNAEKSATLLAIALKVVLEATEVVVMVEVLAAMAVGMEPDAHSRLATLAAATDTCLAIVLKDRNATTAEKSAI
ncbi:MAG: hypothetical protein LQ337_004777 [Flavoplaca oasis]|nr:MAG: hypothetical protein LQ337_004777 [Flavoplaca oasis]